jgi:hypothetical protein
MTGIRQEPSLTASIAYEVGIIMSISIDLISGLSFSLAKKTYIMRSEV